MHQLRIMPAVNGYILVVNEKEPFVYAKIEQATSAIEALFSAPVKLHEWREKSINPEFYSNLHKSCHSGCRDEEDEGNRASEVCIRAVLNGFLVTVGCTSVVFTDPIELCKEIQAFYKKPSAVRKRYQEGSINSHMVDVAEEVMQEGGSGRARNAARRIRRNP